MNNKWKIVVSHNGTKVCESSPFTLDEMTNEKVGRGKSLFGNELKNAMIDQLAEDLPPWAYNCNDFKRGETPVYYSGPFFDSQEIKAALKSFLMGKWLVTGEEVAKFQWKFGRKFGVDHAHMVNSGSSANLVLVTALKKRFGWDSNAEIIVSPVGFPTTIAPIVQNGMKPVFADIEMDTLNFDLRDVERKITDNTVAIFVSPVLGNPPDMNELKRIADAYGVMLIGDNCDSLGTKWNGVWLTEYYTAWTTSFYPAHHITTGEGGMVCSDDAELINLARSISWWGRDCICVGAANLKACGTCGNRFDKWLKNYDGVVDHKYVFTNMGYNLKPLDMQGAIGSVQLDKFDTIHTRRRNSYSRIKGLIKQYVPQVRVVSELPQSETSWFGVPIVCDDHDTKVRLQKHFEDNKIQTRNYFAGNILLHPGYAHLDYYAKYPNANKALSHVFFVGAAPHYDEPVFEYIEEVLSQWT
jgi:CDP-6-deoxy-D-xylo-4-hexulose-3-dehydrase